jgi:hypothetical protein
MQRVAVPLLHFPAWEPAAATQQLGKLIYCHRRSTIGFTDTQVASTAGTAHGLLSQSCEVDFCWRRLKGVTIGSVEKVDVNLEQVRAGDLCTPRCWCEPV